MISPKAQIASTLLACAAACGAAAAEEAVPPAGRYYFAPMLSYTLADDARGTDDGYGGVLALGRQYSGLALLPRLQLELRGQYTRYGEGERGADGPLCAALGQGCAPPARDDTVSGAGVGANLFFTPANPDSGFFDGLYLHLDAMIAQTTLYNAGLGYDMPLDARFGERLAPGLALRAEALYHADADDLQEVQFNLGLRIPFGAPPPPPPPPEPVQVVPPVEASPPPPPPPPPPCEPPRPGAPMTLDGCKAGDTLVLHGVNFDFDRATLTVDARALLDQVADALLQRPLIAVEIRGHTDARGSETYNQALSERRARAVRDYLVARGVDAARLAASGLGESMPVADNGSDEGRERNRRVELKVTGTP